MINIMYGIFRNFLNQYHVVFLLSLVNLNKNGFFTIMLNQKLFLVIRVM